MNMQWATGWSVKIASVALFALLLMLAGACSNNHNKDNDAGTDTGSTDASAGKGGAGGKGGSGGTSTGMAGAAATVPPMMMVMCTETAPTDPVMCGGEVCQAPTDFGMNPCIIPCCVMQGGKELCASKSTAMGFSTDCAMLAVPDPQCPDVDNMGTPLKGCCNAAQHKCGIISTLRPGCITESTLVMLPADPQSCSVASDDAGTGLDGG